MARLALLLLLVLVAGWAVVGCAVTVPGRAVPAPPELPRATGTVVPDVVADECLLDAAGFARLLGAPVAEPANGGVPRSCATRTLGPPTTLASIDVHGVRSLDPAVLLTTGRRLTGVGDAAALVATAGGPVLQVATGTYLVTLAVADHEPPDAAWAEAGRAAVAELGRAGR